jgi:hypothetical protein
MENQTAPPAPSTPAVLAAHPPMQTPSAVTSPTPPSAPAPSVQAAQPARTASPAPPRIVPSVQVAPPVQIPEPLTKSAVPALPAALAQHTQAAPTTRTASTVEEPKASTPGAEHAGEPDGLEVEAAVERHITNLWADREKKKSSLIKTKDSLRTTKEQLSIMRAELGKHFFELKTLLATPGRAGRWADFLREVSIPRATADRYAESHKRLLEGDHGKRLTESIPLPTEAAIKKMVEKLTPGLVRALPTPDSVTQFLRQMTAALRPSGSPA